MSEFIALDPAFVALHTRAAMLARLQRICGSVALELSADGRRFRVLGPATPYHAVDPCLSTATRLHMDLPTDGLGSFRQTCPAYDLCFEDSWSGYFVARWLLTSPRDDEIVFIHCDHHTDMMPSLLRCDGRHLVDATTGHSVDLHDADDWAKAIATGAIGIGTFVTALFYLRRRLHVRHINNCATSTYATYPVTRVTQRYAEIPGVGFASVRKKLPGSLVSPENAGTYRGGRDAACVLAALPAPRAIVHIDLDYLINDFNGNPTPTPPGWAPSLREREIAAIKLDALVDALSHASVRVERWIIATSPGFCSAYHWRWLLDQIEHRIGRLSSSETTVTHDS